MKSIHFIILSIVVVLTTITGSFFINQEDKTVALDLEQVFENFSATKEYQQELSKVQSKHKMVLDSIRLQTIAYGSANNRNDTLLWSKQQYYQQVSREFQQNEQTLTQEYDRKIWNQIQQYVKEFGDEKGYRFIQGKRKDGGVIYVQEGYDETEAFIQFINKKYDGE